jgi:hypothetical protein
MAGVLAATVGITAVAITACARPDTTDPRLVPQYVHALYGTIRVEQLSAPVASRLTAYASTALYAGLAAVRPTMPRLEGTVQGIPALPTAEQPQDYDATVVAVSAERVMLDALLREALPTTRTALTRLADSLLADRRTQGVSPAMAERSVAFGTRIGAMLVQWAAADGFAGTRGRPYAPPVGAGLWANDAPAALYSTQSLSGASQFIALDNPANHQRTGNLSDRALILSRPKSAGTKTLPAANIAGVTEPYWRELRPFVLTAWNQCAIAPPPAFSSDTLSELARNARTVRDTKGQLTAEEREIALYWADNAGESGTPVGHWLSIASQMISVRHLSTNQAAQLVLATALAHADAFIAAWGYKFQYNLLRPRMYIRQQLDPTWEPLIPTPPFPEYPSGHSTQSAAASAAITAMLGATPFADSTSVSLGHAVRRFPSFAAASDEAGRSRVLGGIHFPIGNTAGRELGRCIGTQVVNALHLTPISSTTP